jgi:glucosamine--fructose-6-phosphate aminotransferase (isomerizing)
MDINSQPDVLRAFAGSELPAEISRLSLDDYDRVVLTGMGSSYFAAHRTWSALVSAGYPAWCVSTAQLLDLQDLIGNESLLWVTSQSGESGEVVALIDGLASAKRRPSTLLAMTNDTDSTLAAAADIVVALRSGEEAAVSTKTYVASLAAHERTLGVFLDADDASIVEQILSASDELARFSPRLDTIASAALKEPQPRFALVSNPLDLSSAHVGALLLKEVAKVAAEGFIRGEFRHGPLELAGPGLTAVLFGSGIGDRPLALLDEDLVRTGALVVHVDPGPGSVLSSHTITTGSTSALGRLVCGAKLGQLLSVELARGRGIEPGTFRFGRKVTTAL